MAHHRHASTSSYAPVLINPSSDPARARRPSIDPARPADQKLRYPYPLPVLACLDLGYTVYHAHHNPTTWLIIALCAVRCVVLTLVLGCSRRWRTRGGFVAVACGLSVGLAVWTLCKSQLEKGKTTTEYPTPVHVVFLAITAGMAVTEYITFLLLLRLSPPLHRSNPLSLRLPHSAIQSPTAFHYDTEPLPSSAAATPTISRTHFRHSSRSTLLQPTAGPSYTSGEDFEEEFEDEDNDEDIDMGDEESDSSSISESSIIDLPPPLAPSRIAPSLSMNRGLDIIAAIDQTPVFGAVVRRTRSARFLGRSWGSRSGDEEGYGTFGNGSERPS